MLPEHRMDASRSGSRKAGPARTRTSTTRVRAQGHDKDSGDGQSVVPSDPTLRVQSLESLLVDKGLVDRKALDALIDIYEHQVGPRNGARVVAKAWVDSAYRQRLLTNAVAA